MATEDASLLKWSKEQIERAERWVGRKLFAAAFERGERSMLFIFGHMRTGSSLLVHVLNSHPDVMGYGETHNVYAKACDFGATTAKVCRHLRALPDGERHVLDKVLHKCQIARTQVLNHSSVRILFLLRQPDMALSSMVRHQATEGAESAYQHYAEQLAWISGLARRLPAQKWTPVTYSELVHDTVAVFSRLEKFLRLSEPLTEMYETTPYTGTRGIGDSGPYIQAGFIRRDIDREIDPRVLPYMHRAEKQFERCLEELQAYQYQGLRLTLTGR
jgi:hypothetical protein